MASIFDLVIQTVTGTPGTGSTITLGSAATINGSTYLTLALAGVTNGQSVEISLIDPVNGGVEQSRFTYSTTGPSLTGRTVLKSSNSNLAINASSSTLIRCSPSAELLNDGSIITTGIVNFQRLNLPGYIYGLTLSTAGSSATFGIASGQATDTLYLSMMQLSSAYTKTTSSWAVGSGNGALDTGSIANSTWYHVWLIQRSDTGVVDVLISTSATSPTLPTNYDRKRRIGSMKTNGSAQWTSFTQIGDNFYWATQVTDYIGSSRANALLTLTVPSGLTVFPIISAKIIAGAGSADAQMYVGNGTFPSANMIVAAGGDNYGRSGSTSAIAFTNTSSQIRMAATGNVLSGNNSYIITDGWIDYRDRV